MLGDVFYNIDADVMVLGLLFVIFFAIINLSLRKTLKDRGTSGIVSFCVSLLAVYGISRTNWDVSGLFYSIGLSDNILYTVVPLIIIAGLIFMFWKMRTKLGLALMLVGIALIIASFFVYEKITILIIGIAVLILGIILWFIQRRRGGNLAPGAIRTGSKSGGAFWLFIIALSSGLMVYGIISNNPWFSIGGGIMLGLTILFYIFGSKKKDNLNTNQQQTTSNGRDALIRAAKNFNNWARRQPNPKFVGNWANFVNYLKRGGWGRNEAEICQRLNISQRDFVNIFNRYGLV